VTRRVPTTFDSLDPVTGETVGTYPVHSAADVAAAIDRARIAATWWSELPSRERTARLLGWKGVIARRLGQLAHLVNRETGKPHGEAQLEIITAIDQLDWAARHARRVLRTRHRRPALLTGNYSASVRWEPLGIVGVIAPWNYPVYTAMGSVAFALAAGNAVVLKPSEFTPAVGAWLVDTFAETIPEQPVLQLLTGHADTGAALCRSGVDKLTFTGSTAIGKKVMAACAETLTPVLLELGGKDAVLVDEDADLQTAAEETVWGGLAHGGQICISVERVYVHERVFDEFLSRVVALTQRVRAGADDEARYGPLTLPAQSDTIRRHVEDALSRGARAVVGGLESVQPPYVDPVVLTDVPEDSAAVTEETFGPVLVVNRVREMDEAVDRVNGTNYALGASIFSRRRGTELARRVRAGMVSINSVIGFAGVPALPWGGAGASGFGRIHGEEGLKEFARPKAIARRIIRLPLPLQSFDRSATTDQVLATLTQLRHGRRPRRHRAAPRVFGRE
jgi:acyl-CoA reductase-like NAD-dependent aldehyde dehydrogenase